MRARSAKRPPAILVTALSTVAAGETWGRWLAATTTDNMIELDLLDRKRIFNLGYFTWVETARECRSRNSRRCTLNNLTGMG